MLRRRGARLTLRTYSDLLSLGEFRALFVSRCFVIASVSLSSLALGTVVYDETGSTILSALAMFGGPLITLVGSATLLSLSDRLDGRDANVIAITAAGLAAAAQAVPGLPWPVRFVVLALPFLVMSATAGSVNRMLRAIVPPEAFVLGRSTLNVAVGLMQVVGYATGGLLLQWLPVSAVFGVAALCAVLAGLAVALGVRRRPVERSGGSLVRTTHEVNRRLLGSRTIRPILLASWVPNGLIVGCEALFVPYGGTALAGYLFAVTAAGMLLGDVLVGRVLPAPGRERLLHPLRLLLAVPYLGFFLDPPIPVALALGFCASIGYSASLVLQERLAAAADPATEGQAFGLQGNGMMIGQSAGALLGGLVATWLDTGHSMGWLAAASVVVTVALVPGLRRSAPTRA